MPLIAQAPQGGGLMAFLPFVVMIAIFYLLIIRPQMKRQKEHAAMQQSLTSGDQIVTTGGVHGVIKSVKEDSLQVKIAENTVVDLDRNAVARKKNA
ncbi:MAG: preprotein translocase subunit YajC [Candidatus Delongbacteria bacterium]|nr:preprotein translocase subunit YajC [Candidatus Cloacimonadota bacterium]MCA9785935.1 preprotein translocase subunit YajC [Candidatus Cloacimonadota bacterium]MCB9474079.1 preprotein translocase subunit YajC [Candidatus Delongbacteria bacterium]